MESIEDSMDPRAKVKHEEEHEDSKKERKARTRLPAWYELSKKNQAE